MASVQHTADCDAFKLMKLRLGALLQMCDPYEKRQQEKKEHSRPNYVTSPLFPLEWHRTLKNSE